MADSSPRVGQRQLHDPHAQRGEAQLGVAHEVEQLVEARQSRAAGPRPPVAGDRRRRPGRRGAVPESGGGHRRRIVAAPGLDVRTAWSVYIATRYIERRLRSGVSMSTGDAGTRPVRGTVAVHPARRSSDGPKHGYAIMTDVEAISGSPLGPGTLYARARAARAARSHRGPRAGGPAASVSADRGRGDAPARAARGDARVRPDRASTDSVGPAVRGDGDRAVHDVVTDGADRRAPGPGARGPARPPGRGAARGGR